jgi:hypothetical protein
VTNEKKYDPFTSYKQLTSMWEKQLTGLLFMLTDNKEFVRTANLGLNAYSRYLERFRNNQELMASIMNIPTKKDIARVAKQSIQTEEKIDILEEQIWSVQDSVAAFNKENLAFLQEVVTTVNQMKAEFQKTAEVLAETQKFKADLQELRQGLVDIKILQVKLQEMRSELAGIKQNQAELTAFMKSDEIQSQETDIQELKQELAQLADIKMEISELKSLLDNQKELVLTGENTSK